MILWIHIEGMLGLTGLGGCGWNLAASRELMTQQMGWRASVKTLATCLTLASLFLWKYVF